MPSSAALICLRRSAISSARSRSRASTLSLSIVAKRSSLRLSVGCPAVGVAVVSDTTGYLPREVVAANRIHLVSLYVVFGGERTEREADITDYAAFFEELRSVEQLPTTSQPSVGDFIATYEPLLAAGDDVVSIHISGGLSGTHESARQAAEQLERDSKGGERAHVIDSPTATGGLGLIALAAARCASGGAGIDAVLERVSATRDALKMWFAIDTL